MVQRVASNGYVRNKLTVLHGGKRSASARAEASARSDAGAEPALPLFEGAARRCRNGECGGRRAAIHASKKSARRA